VGWWGDRGRWGNGDRLQTTERPFYVPDHISTDDSVTGFAVWTEAFDLSANSLISRPLVSQGHPSSGSPRRSPHESRVAGRSGDTPRATRDPAEAARLSRISFS